MNKQLAAKIVEICQQRIESKGETVGLSCYAFFSNRNDNPELLMDAATWWIMAHKFDHFENAAKIRDIVKRTQL